MKDFRTFNLNENKKSILIVNTDDVFKYVKVFLLRDIPNPRKLQMNIIDYVGKSAFETMIYPHQIGYFTDESEGDPDSYDEEDVEYHRNIDNFFKENGCVHLETVYIKW
tara:strand:+ start:84554 stop:84880 length:327 start_codon:yes stop_codon:yes gene_type:complete